MKETGLPREKIGIIFISPCPSKVTYAKAPLGTEHSEVDRVLAIKDVYPQLLSCMKAVGDDPPEIGTSGKIGISWGRSGGEASGLFTEEYLAADGIENVIRVLEDMEDQKFTNLKFVELNACNGGLRRRRPDCGKPVCGGGQVKEAAEVHAGGEKPY